MLLLFLDISIVYQYSNQLTLTHTLYTYFHCVPNKFHVTTNSRPATMGCLKKSW